MKKVFIVAGRRSSLAMSLRQAAGENVIFYDGVVNVPAKDEYMDCYLWLSPHADPEAWDRVPQPKLFVSSAATLQPHLAETPYVKCKTSMMRTPCAIVIPGFFIEDTGVTDGGLHLETSRAIFSLRDPPPDIDMTKSYAVTPKSFAVKAIHMWIQDPSVIQIGIPARLYSKRAYSRQQLRAEQVDDEHLVTAIRKAKQTFQ